MGAKLKEKKQQISIRITWFYYSSFVNLGCLLLKFCYYSSFITQVLLLKFCYSSFVITQVCLLLKFIFTQSLLLN